MGRSRGGLTTKIHALVDAGGLPIALKLTYGEAHDGRSADDMLGSLAPARSCSATAPTIPTCAVRRSPSAGHGPTSSRCRGRKNVPVFSPLLYRYRNLVERFFNKLKHFRAVATRYDKDPDNYLATVKLASARIWMV